MPNFTLKFQAIFEILIIGPRPILAFFPQCHDRFTISWGEESKNDIKITEL